MRWVALAVLMLWLGLSLLGFKTDVQVLSGGTHSSTVLLSGTGYILAFLASVLFATPMLLCEALLVMCGALASGWAYANPSKRGTFSSSKSISSRDSPK
jgi:high-affinity nickel permease